MRLAASVEQLCLYWDAFRGNAAVTAAVASVLARAQWARPIADADGASGVIVEIPLAADHDDFVLEACRVGKTSHARRVKARNPGSGGQQEAGGGTGGDIAGFGTGDFCDNTGGSGLKFGDIDAMARCLSHCG